MRQKRRQGHAPYRGGPLEAEIVPATQHDPGIQGEGSADSIGQLLTGLLAEIGEFRGKSLESGLAQLEFESLPALDQGRMADELAGRNP